MDMAWPRPAGWEKRASVISVPIIGLSPSQKMANSEGSETLECFKKIRSA